MCVCVQGRCSWDLEGRRRLILGSALLLVFIFPSGARESEGSFFLLVFIARGVELVREVFVADRKGARLNEFTLLARVSPGRKFARRIASPFRETGGT